MNITWYRNKTLNLNEKSTKSRNKSNIKSIVGIGGFENGIGGGRRGHTHGTNHVCIVKVENLKSRKPTKDNWFHPADSFIQKWQSNFTNHR